MMFRGAHLTPSPPWGEGRGEGDASHGLSGIRAVPPPHPNPLPGGERGSFPVPEDPIPCMRSPFANPCWNRR
ncbi:hypothetical protein FZ983_32685 [Azospirillum sp. B21]|nr:hypothetical protein FZ983_32685 [Azospirillum sp. B21]